LPSSRERKMVTVYARRQDTEERLIPWKSVIVGKSQQGKGGQPQVSWEGKGGENPVHGWKKNNPSRNGAQGSLSRTQSGRKKLPPFGTQGDRSFRKVLSRRRKRRQHVMSAQLNPRESRKGKDALHGFSRTRKIRRKGGRFVQRSNGPGVYYLEMKKKKNRGWGMGEEGQGRYVLIEVNNKRERGNPTGLFY